MKLYTSALSTAALRVRIALHLKKLKYEEETVEMAGDNSDPIQPEFLELNPEGSVPVLVDGQRILVQSLAIMEYLDESYDGPCILPGNNRDRSRIRGLSELIATDIAPLVSYRRLRQLETVLGLEEDQLETWRNHALNRGMNALEAMMADNPASLRFSNSDIPSMADICLVAEFHPMDQIPGASERYPTISRIYRSCMELPGFRDALSKHNGG